MEWNKHLLNEVCDQDLLCFSHGMKTRPKYTDDACRNTYKFLWEVSIKFVQFKKKIEVVWQWLVKFSSSYRQTQ